MCVHVCVCIMYNNNNMGMRVNIYMYVCQYDIAGLCSRLGVLLLHLTNDTLISLIVSYYVIKKIILGITKNFM